MYNQKLVASLKANGKILREFKDTVYVPFGTEYSILLKNLSTVRCIVNLSIDGTDVVPGGLVINAGQVVDLERWIKNGNLNEGNKFKFIERTAQIEQHRGIGLEDGIINISYQFEQPQIRATTIWDHNTGQWDKQKWLSDQYYGSPMRGIGGSGGQVLKSANYPTLNSVSIGSVTAQSAEPQLMNVSNNDSASYNDAGITVPGGKSEQKFSTASWFPVLPEKHSIVLKLLGETPDNKPVLKPVTVKAKPKCETCGKLNKANAKFCSACGTSLEIFA